jgi:hypothetical protein
MKSMRAAADWVVTGISSTVAAIHAETIVSVASSESAAARRNSYVSIDVYPFCKRGHSDECLSCAGNYFKGSAGAIAGCDEAFES